MTVFDELFQQSGFPLLLDLYGEEVVVDDGSSKRTIRAIVDRNPPTPYGLDESVQLPEITISVFNNARTGIASKSFKSSLRIEVSRVKGREPVSLMAMALIDDSGGTCVIGLR